AAAVLRLSALPGKRGVKRHPVDPGRECAVTPERLDRAPHLQRDLLEQVLAIRMRRPVGAGHLEEDGLVRLDPLSENPVASPSVIPHLRAVSSAEGLVPYRRTHPAGRAALRARAMSLN